MSQALIAFIIGAGKNVGEHTAAALKGKGYQVVLGSHAPVIDQVKKDGYFPVAVNVENPESVKRAFAPNQPRAGAAECASISVAPPNPADPLTLPLETFKQHTDIGLSVYAAAQEAIRGFWSETHKGALKTFIVTGNPLPWIPATHLNWIGLNVEKTVQWRLMELLSHAYSKEGSRFYFASIVGETGDIVNPLSVFFTSGPQHAQVYLDLVTREDQADWDYRFTLEGKQWRK
ncbi:hypothetical protein B0H14DRAFT_3437228 [Mycena olivaceomarginata]|nr:hypothetical protein B0H14DRAFT_3437228 [Mycena olivaceomarginata]